MPRKKLLRPKPWTLKCSEEVHQPKGPQRCLLAAVEALGPFEHKTMAEAEARGLWTEENGTRLGISEELAFELVEEVAKRFNAEEHLARQAPRFKHVAQHLREVKKRSDALAECLEAFDDITRCEFQNAGAPPGHQKHFKSLMEAADVAGLPKISTDECGITEGSWVHRLKSLSELAGLTLSNAIYRRRRSDQRDALDKGGNTNLWKENAGIPRWGLVTDALAIYEIFKPSEATSTVGGPFHQFVLEIFEYATGYPGITHAKVEDWLKRLVKPTRLDREAEAKIAQLDSEWDEILERDLGYDEEAKIRMCEIRAEIDELERYRRKLWTKTWPHMRLRPPGE